MGLKLKPTKVKCPKCKSKTEEIYYYFGLIRNKCVKCNYIFNPPTLINNKINVNSSQCVREQLSTCFAPPLNW